MVYMFVSSSVLVFPATVCGGHGQCSDSRWTPGTAPAIRTEGPAVAEHHRLSCAPVLVIDLRAAFRRNRTHCLPPFFILVSMPRFKNDLGPALLARIKVFVAFGRSVEWQFVRDDEGRFRFSLCDQLTQLAVVCFYICLASPDVLALDPKLAKIERNLTLLGQFIFGVRIFRYENPHNSDTASRAHRFY